MNKREIAKEIFDTIPGMDVAWITDDGQGFSNGHSANEHQKNVLGRRELNSDQLPEKFSREEFAGEKSEVTENSKPVKAKAEDLIAKINEAKTATEVDEIVGADNRATVNKAAEAKKTELAGQAEATGGETK